MRQPRQNLALAQKAREYRLAVHAALDEFQRNALFELSVDALRQHDHAHAPAAQFTLHPPAADGGADGCCLVVTSPLCSHCDPQFWHVLIEYVADGIRLDQRLDLTTQCAVVAATALEQGIAFGWRQFDDLIEHRADATPAFGIHVIAPQPCWSDPDVAPGKPVRAANRD